MIDIDSPLILYTNKLIEQMKRLSLEERQYILDKIEQHWCLICGDDHGNHTIQTPCR
jgi:hypothetical protein